MTISDISMLFGGGQAMQLHSTFRRAQQSMAQSLERLATGKRLNSPADDPVGYKVLQRLNTQVRGTTQAIQNINSAYGYVSNADSALGVMSSIVNEIRDLAVVAANGTTTDDERSDLDTAMDELLEEFNALSSFTEYDGVKLLDGTFSTQTLQIGPNAGESFSYSIGDARALKLGTLAIQSGTQDAITSGVSTSNGVKINNYSIGASTSDGVSYASAASSSIAIVNAINLSSEDHDVTAVALDTEVTLNNLDFSVSVVGGWASGAFQINGVSIVGTPGTASGFVDLVNNYTSSTGVTAEIGSSSDQVIFRAADGRNITLEMAGESVFSFGYYIFNHTGGNNSAVLGVKRTVMSTGGSDTSRGAIQLQSASQFTVANGASGNASAVLGFAVGSFQVDNSKSLGNIDLSSQSKAEDALTYLDQAIEDITRLRANVGVVHNRLDTTSQTLTALLEETKNSQSQIENADLALEVADMVAAQIRSEASLASLIQANLQASRVIELLRY